MLRVYSRQLEALAASCNPATCPSLVSIPQLIGTVDGLLCLPPLLMRQFLYGVMRCFGWAGAQCFGVSKVPCTQQKRVTLPGAARWQFGK